jgi:cell fate regulator YaaT (PSP1 superfamily)
MNEDKLVRVRLRGRGKAYDFSTNGLDLKKRDIVIVETVQGVEIGVVTTVILPLEAFEGGEERTLRPVLRLASAEDLAQYEANLDEEDRAFSIAMERIEAHGLDMSLVDVEFRFDNKKITFFFTANGRVDFRDLVKDLAAIFRRRIELRQIGVRDEARMCGGIGSCGREFCCSTFLHDFQPVSIKMAKEQNLSMNPEKISGACGRLLCCLNYEQEAYVEARQRLPKRNDKVTTPDGPGVVMDVNLLTEMVTVSFDKGDERVSKSFKAADLSC